MVCLGVSWGDLKPSSVDLGASGKNFRDLGSVVAKTGAKSSHRKTRRETSLFFLTIFNNNGNWELKDA
jgi:hypothetical protein